MAQLRKTGEIYLKSRYKPQLPQMMVVAGLFSLVCLIWATTWIGIKLTIASIPPLTAAGLRFLITFSIMLVIVRVTDSPLFFPRNKKKFFAFITIFYFGIPYFLMNYGEQYIAPSLAALIFSAMPVFSLIFSVILLHQRTSAWQVAGIVIGFFGFFMIFRNELTTSQFGSTPGIIALVTAAVIHGFCYVFTKRFGKDIDVITYNTLPIGFAGLAMTLSGLSIEHTSWTSVTLTSWAALIYLAIAAVIAFLAYFYLLKIVSPIVASFSYLIFPVLAILIDAELTGEPIGASFLLFTAVILIGFAITKLTTPR